MSKRKIRIKVSEMQLLIEPYINISFLRLINEDYQEVIQTQKNILNFALNSRLFLAFEINTSINNTKWKTS